MLENKRPTILASKCLGFAPCRYNGVSLQDPFIELIKSYVDFITVCPEVEIGLSVPRDPIRIVKQKNLLRLLQPATGLDLTEKMNDFANNFLHNLPAIDGFVLKFRSPSCGLAGVKVYSSTEKGGSFGNTRGFFGAEVIDKFENYPIEDEGRLKNFTIREHFLTQIFILRRFREIEKSMKYSSLVEFHTKNKFLLMSYSQTGMRLLGKIVANHEKICIENVLKLYRKGLLHSLSKPPRTSNAINTIQHAFGYFSEKLTKQERLFYLKTLEEYRGKRIPLSVPTNILKSYIIRFEIKYLLDQTFFEPYPKELSTVADSGKGRDL